MTKWGLLSECKIRLTFENHKGIPYFNRKKWRGKIWSYQYMQKKFFLKDYIHSFESKRELV